MSKKEKETKCELCKKHKATYECEMCSTKFCRYCAKVADYECPLCMPMPPELLEIKK